jgi:hypothetical protein
MFFFLIRKQNPTAQEKDNQWSPTLKASEEVDMEIDHALKAH